MLSQNEPKPAIRPIGFDLAVCIIVQAPSRRVLDLAPRCSEGDIHSLADRIQVGHPVAASVLRPGELSPLPNDVAHRIRVGRQADPIERDVGDGGLVEEHSLVPLGDARLGRISLDEWLRRSHARA
jgi:hypothetical protein